MNNNTNLKEEYKNNKDEPKIKKKDNQLLRIFLFTIKLIIVVTLFLMTNGSLVYFIKVAGDEVINKILPSKCDEYPYGTKNVNPCNNNNLVSSSLSSKLTEMFSEKMNLQTNENKCNMGAGIPYKWYRKNSDSILHNYLNWLLISLAETQIDLNTYLKEGVKWIKNLTISTDSILIVVSGFLFMLLLPLIHLYTLISLVFKQVTTFWKFGIIEMILIILSGFFIWTLDTFVATFNLISLTFELIIKPLFNKSQREVIMNIIRRENILIGYIFGFMFLQILYMIKMNKNIEKPIKIIPTVIFLLIVGIHLIKYLYGVVSKIGGSRNKCT